MVGGLVFLMYYERGVICSMLQHGEIKQYILNCITLLLAKWGGESRCVWPNGHTFFYSSKFGLKVNAASFFS
jgi:hypothetical protein